MAKPIQPTPTLTGKDAERFLRLMVEKQNSKITTKEIALAEEIRNFNIPVKLVSPAHKSAQSP